MNPIVPVSNRSKRTKWVYVGTRCSGATLHVLCYLAERGDDEGISWPSQQTIATDTRCSVRSVRYALGTLAKDGWIKTYLHRGRNTVNVYQVNLARLEKAYHDAQAEKKRKRLALDLVKNSAPACGNVEEKSKEVVENSQNRLKTLWKSCGEAPENPGGDRQPLPQGPATIAAKTGNGCLQTTQGTTHRTTQKSKRRSPLAAAGFSKPFFKSFSHTPKSANRPP